MFARLQNSPPGIVSLVFIQLFSTLSFSVLYSTLVLYLTGGLHLSDLESTAITASFVAFNYSLHLLSGFLGGRLMSYRFLFCVGMVATIIGCLFISIPTHNSLYWGLAFFLTGSGLNVTCINCMVTQVFDPEDNRRETAFLWNYSGMNLGFFVGFGMSGYFQLSGNYTTLFAMSSIGNLIAMIIVFFNWHALRDRHTSLSLLPTSQRYKRMAFGISCALLLIVALRGLLKHSLLSNELIIFAGALMGALIFFLAFKQSTQAAKKRMFAYLVLAVMSIVFWTLYQMMPMGLTLFINRNVDRHIMGITIPPQWLQNINTFIIIFGAPFLASMFGKIRARGWQLNIPFQFAMGLLFIGVGFVILPWGISLASPMGMVGIGWVISCYVLQTLGELFISPIGYAMIGRLAPPRLQGLMMGTWLMLTGFAAVMSRYASQMALGKDPGDVNPLVTNPSFSHTFGTLGWAAVVAGIIMLFLMPSVRRMIDGANK